MTRPTTPAPADDGRADDAPAADLPTRAAHDDAGLEPAAPHEHDDELQPGALRATRVIITGPGEGQTLRAWERRYDVVQPGRSDGGQRLYSDHDVERLSHLRQLIDVGRPISMVAALPTDEIEALLEIVAGRLFVRRDAGKEVKTELHCRKVSAS